MFEIIRIIADGSRRLRKIGNDVPRDPPKCGVMFTGEYYVGDGSDAARLLPIWFTTPIDPVKLKECQDEPLALSTFYSNFITWYLSNYSQICELLRTWLNSHRHSMTSVRYRLQDTQFCLLTAYRLLLTYLEDIGVITVEQIGVEYQTFYSKLAALVQEQDRRTKQNHDSTQIGVDYLEAVRVLYRSGKLSIAKDKDHFDVATHDGLFHQSRDFGNCLCLRVGKLAETIQTAIPTVKFEDVKKTLSAQGKARFSVQIGGGGVGGLRFDWIKRHLMGG